MSSEERALTFDRRSRPRRLFDTGVGKFFTASMYTLATAAKTLPWARRRLRAVQVHRDHRYGNPEESTIVRGPQSRTFDLYAPLAYRSSWLNSKASADEERDDKSPFPFVLYIHGGGFRTLSKDTHWTFGLRFAEEGFVVFVINYRLTPEHPCPAGLEDCAVALDWILDHAEELNIDLDRGMIAGESAGGHLTLALALALTRPDHEPWAQRIYRHNWMPKMIAPACAFLDLESSGRLEGEMKPFYQSRLDALGRAYLRGCSRRELALPLEELASDRALDRPFPPTLITVGGADVILRDSERLAEHMVRREIIHELIVYPRGIHAFHAMITHPLAERCWRDHIRFWKRCLDEEPTEGHQGGMSGAEQRAHGVNDETS